MSDFVVILADYSWLSVFLFYFVLIQFRGLALAGGLQCQLQPVSGAYTGNSTAQKSVSWLCNVIADYGVVLVMSPEFL